MPARLAGVAEGLGPLSAALLAAQSGAAVSPVGGSEEAGDGVPRAAERAATGITLRSSQPAAPAFSRAAPPWGRRNSQRQRGHVGGIGDVGSFQPGRASSLSQAAEADAQPGRLLRRSYRCCLAHCRGGGEGSLPASLLAPSAPARRLPKADDPRKAHRRGGQAPFIVAVPPLSLWSGVKGGAGPAPRSAGPTGAQPASARPEQTLRAEPGIVLALSRFPFLRAAGHGLRREPFAFVVCRGLHRPRGGGAARPLLLAQRTGTMFREGRPLGRRGQRPPSIGRSSAALDPGGCGSG